MRQGQWGRRRAVRPLVLGAMLALSLSACGKKERLRTVQPVPKNEAAAPAPEVKQEPAGDATPDLAPSQRLARAVELLTAGDEGKARDELRELLRQEPNRREALVLRQSLEDDYRSLLPSGSFAYTVQPGDTYISLALDFLGDSYKFYALTRLNGVTAADLKPGTVIQIPGRFRQSRRERDREREAARRVAPRPRPAADAPAPAPAVQPRTNPAAARRYRRSGLEALSAGRVGVAVQRLEQAARYDPGNPAIEADLARARRLQATVRGRN